LESSLPFKVPEEVGLSVFTDMHVAASMRSLVNNVSQPNTPDEIVFRERNQLNNIDVCKFFQVVAVRMGEQKRSAIALSPTEIAIGLGAADHPHRSTYFFISALLIKLSYAIDSLS
ncbi:MAG: hypothetical protein ACK559_32225, partial [bacterium]